MALSPERWHRVEAILHSALALDGNARDAFLDAACGDDADLRREVESLLAQSASGGVLDHPLSALRDESRTVALAPGNRLGPYEIEGLIGQGGMGMVYRARDTRLSRTVAIKTVRARFSPRFEREARAVAALNHPNICHLYDVGSDYLVMEYIEGMPLRGPLAADEALKYAEQILDALDAAHRAGIVHRDLKPGNILVSKQGIKLLDFGLAHMESGPDDPTVMPSVGLMGTPAYMAPEQWEGKPADARSDIYAFGCVLHEMLTGKKANDNRAAVPPRFEGILRTCLEKDPDERWQTARELKHALRWAKGIPAAVKVAGGGLRGTAGWIAAGVFGAVLAVMLLVHFREAPPTSQILYASITVPESDTVPNIAISPDGRNLVMAVESGGVRQLWLRAMNSPEAHPLPFTEGALYPFWSPDSRFIGFFAMGKLKKIAAGGGPPQSLCGAPAARGGSWSRDNVIVFSPANSGISIQRVSASGGVPVDVTRTKGNQRHPRFLPDSRHFLYLKRDAEQGENGIYVSSLDGRENRRLLPDISGVEFAPASPGARNGHILFVRDGTLMAAPFDAVSAQIAGDVFPLAQGVSLVSPSSYMPVSVSDNGVLLYQAADAGGEESQIALFDRSGKPLGPVSAPGKVSNPAFSPDEKLVAFQRANGAGEDLWLRDLNRGTETRLTNDASSNVAPFWSPSGDRIVFASNRSGVFNLYQKAVSGSGPETRLLANRITDSPTQWSRDGRFIVFFELDPKNKRDLWVLPTRAGAVDGKPVPFLQSEFDELLGQISPDGHWMAFTTDQSGRREVFVRPFPRGEGAWIISINGGQAPRWRGDGKELFFVAADGKLMAVPVKTATPGSVAFFEAGTPFALFDAHISRNADDRYFQYDVTADGKRFLITTGSGGTKTERSLTIVTNWLAATKK